MIVRSVVFEGVVDEVDRAAFDRKMTTAVFATLARYPGIRKVSVRKVAGVEDGAPPIYMVFDLHFDTLADMHAALASSVRQDVRAEVAVVKSSFKGRLYHLIMEDVGVAGPTA